MNERIDALINPLWIVPVEPAHVTLKDHSVALRDGRILAVLPRDEAHRRYLPARSFDLPDHILLPGLVNLHTHAAMRLMQGIADDLPLKRWLEEAIWPTEIKHMSPQFVREGTILAAAEMLRGGITTCNEMYFYPHEAAEAFAQAGMRAIVGITVLDFPTPYASGADDYLRKGLAARDAWAGHSLIDFSLAPHSPYTVSDETLARVRVLADRLGAVVHMHVHETAREVSDSLDERGVRPLARLAELGLLGSDFLGVHAVHLDHSDIELLRTHRCSVAHCPTSNMKLASGIAPVVPLLDSGVNVGLGTDGAASNNRLDMLQEMRHASLLAKVSTLDATAVSAHTALRMATLDGARALGIADRIGSIVPGKEADLCAITLDRIEAGHCFDPASHLAYVAGREHVSHVWVRGEARVDKGESTVLQLNDTELLALAAVWHTRLSS